MLNSRKIMYIPEYYTILRYAHTLIVNFTDIDKQKKEYFDY